MGSGERGHDWAGYNEIVYLLKKGTTWRWTSEYQQAFGEFKEVLQSILLLTHYDPKLPIIVAADASSTAIEAVILQKFPDGSLAERNYRQSEKARVSLRREFHCTPICPRATSTVPTCCPTGRGVRGGTLEDDLVSIIADTIDKVLVSFAALQKATATNAILQAVVKYIRDEWPSSAGSVTNPEVFPYLHQRESLSLVDGCVMFPNQFRHQILRQFHRGHPGSALQRLRAVSSTDSTTKMSNSLSDATLAPLIFFHGFGLADPVAAPVPAIRNSWTTTLKNPTIRSNPVHPKQSSRMVLPPATAALPAEPVSGGRGHPVPGRFSNCCACGSEEIQSGLASTPNKYE
ncbi:conserved hypothetical protein [Culex quinquefasciatus]|uniref:Reverse transcriptase/retrotransposon-derived protein RNase H-like domain-containing protein n=1 Tax=Culex quinquefasciatus TaxID=7176 RepID=B0X5E8_CULQU|nr:conserved hypothetical protein [Culex quinquefasciatus]|eukprot:XP_001864870.1 conserved hypothetical protein [Culex quinquefasciatus]